MIFVDGLGWVLYVVAAFLGLIVVLTIGVAVAKWRSRHHYRDAAAFNRMLTLAAVDGDHAELVNALRRKPVQVLGEIAAYSTRVEITDSLRQVLYKTFRETKGQARLMRYLNARRIDRRLLASRLVRLAPSRELVDQLVQTLRSERSAYAAYSEWYSLLALDDPRALTLVTEAQVLREGPIFQRALLALESAGPRVRAAARSMLPPTTRDRALTLLHLGPHDGDGELGRFLMQSLEADDATIRSEACEIVRRHRPKAVDRSDLLSTSGRECRLGALEAHFSLARNVDFELVDSLLCDPEAREETEAWVAELLRRVPEETAETVDRYAGLPPGPMRDAYARILRSKLPFLLNEYLDEAPEVAAELLRGWVASGQFAGIVDFMNENRLSSIESEMIDRIRPLLGESPEFKAYCSRYLRRHLRDALSVPDEPVSKGTSRIPLTRRDKFLLLALMLGALAFFPALFVVRNLDTLVGMSVGSVLRAFVVDYNYLFAAYAVALNGSYLILLYFSSREMRKQTRMWANRDERALFDGSVLPGMTILAPAYNEEKSVVQSVRSLLALRYPNHQVVVVNDGSRDGTLNAMVEAFEMERVDVLARPRIPTAPVRGLYRNPHIPNLLLVDKENGGKADALNAAINYSETDYICSIDSDSLLERDSLLAMAFAVTSEDREVVAVGGNVLPVNGCSVVGGDLREIHPPRNRIALFQMMEYLRSFIAGRVGWASLDSLVIISGAFGVFSRKRVLEIGGYLTGTGAFKKDTVGEDMELVVRLVRHMKDQRAPFAIKYAHNANCWTEVPEDLGSLLKQRDRWQRGLVEIMSYHKSMVFRRKYGTVGWLTFPYLLAFELVGPLWELLGYFALTASLIFGLLSLQVLALLFAASVLLGIAVSMGSLYLSEKGVLYFKGRDFLRVLAAAIAENFGYRQLLSCYRSWSYVSSLLRNKGWQHLKRRGFQSDPSQTDTSAAG